jgi:hypothetical protein
MTKKSPNPSARLPKAAAPAGKSSFAIVMECVAAAAPDGATYDEDTVLSSIPVRGNDLMICINYRIPLVGDSAWRAKQIKESWTIDTLIARTDYRRNHHLSS